MKVKAMFAKDGRKHSLTGQDFCSLPVFGFISDFCCRQVQNFVNFSTV
jgi:hypothetical protein